MERITSKLRRVLVITLLSAATMATAGSLTLQASSGVPPQDPEPIPRKHLCEAWESARARNSPAAPGLEVQCHTQWAARGQTIEPRYPWAAELRSQLPNASAQIGFDIGMAAAEGQTQHGPNKQTLQNALSLAEREGYIVAVSHSLTWNKEQEKIRNAELAARGAGLAMTDQSASSLLNQLPNDSARRGFYIGMAAAEGHTLPGPRKDLIRASLSPEEQRGFDSAVTYSLVSNNINASNAIAPLPKRGDRPFDDPSTGGRHREPERPVRRGSDSRNLRATLEHLRQGRDFLEAADADEGGHRERALDNINKAIQELQKAMAGTN